MDEEYIKKLEENIEKLEEEKDELRRELDDLKKENTTTITAGNFSADLVAAPNYITYSLDVPCDSSFESSIRKCVQEVVKDEIDKRKFRFKNLFKRKKDG